MKKIYYFYLTAAIVLLVVLYKIWPLPFQAFSQAVILPTANVFVEAGRKVYSPFRLLVDLRNLENRNKDLENQNIQLQAELSKLKNDTYETSQLLNEVNKNTAQTSAVIAKVISRSPGGFNQQIIINKGERDGVRKDFAVLSNGYFIGQVARTDQTQSVIELIFSHGLRVPVKMEKNNDSGLLQGGLEGLVVTDIPIDAKIQSEENVLTSGLGGIIPPGLVVGKIGLHLGVQGELFQKVRVVSPINPFSIEYVTILANGL